MVPHRRADNQPCHTTLRDTVQEPGRGRHRLAAFEGLRPIEPRSRESSAVGRIRCANQEKYHVELVCGIISAQRLDCVGNFPLHAKNIPVCTSKKNDFDSSRASIDSERVFSDVQLQQCRVMMVLEALAVARCRYKVQNDSSAVFVLFKEFLTQQCTENSQLHRHLAAGPHFTQTHSTARTLTRA